MEDTKKGMEQPDEKLQALLDYVMEQEPEEVTFHGKRRRIRWQHNGVMRKISHIMVKDKDPWRRNVKVCACVLLNRRNGLLTWLLTRLCQ